MNMKHWSRPLLSLGLLSLVLGALPAAADEEKEKGLQVVVRLANGELPETQKLVQALTAAGGKHQVQVKKQKTPEKQEATIQVWGRTVPQEEAAKTLRDAFPELASADIQVSALDTPPPARPEGEPGTHIRKIIKKEVKEPQTQE